MGIVMISCPETERAISTGIEVDYETFHSTPVFFSHTLCPFCRVIPTPADHFFAR
jgi:hypothetical protein